MIKRIFSSTIFNTNKTLSDRINTLFNELGRALGFETIFSNRLDERAAEADLLLVYAGVHGKELLRDSFSLASRTKIIYLLTGPHSFSHSVLDSVVKRGDIILCTEGDYMRRKFPHIAEHFKHFPYYFAPHDRYNSLRLDAVPKMKCLFTGHVNPGIYPLRTFLLSQLHGDPELQKVMVRVRHPRYGAKDATLLPYEMPAVLNETYAQALNDHYCSVATGSKYRYVLAKYFEIAAAGALLLAEQTVDSDSVGLVPGIHYVPIDRSHVVGMVKTCVRHPEVFEKIRLAGALYVRSHHSVRNRVEQLKEMINEL